MSCRIIDLQTLPATPWKNGGGTTRQLAIHPPEATLDNFAWRISCARVASGGPFSYFPGVDRSLALLDGAGLGLQLLGIGRTLRPCGEALMFAGEAEVTAQLVDGPVSDLNVMTRRDAWRHRLWYLHLDGNRALHNDAEVLLLLCHGGQVDVRDRATLHRCQALLLEGEQGALHLRGNAACLQVAQLYRHP
jgi:environmental stress-induced protein Ves